MSAVHPAALARPLTDAIGHALVAETMALLRQDLRKAATSAHPDALRTGSIEIALVRVVGAIAGREAEAALGRLLGWSTSHDFGGLARESAQASVPPGPQPAAPTPELLEALLGLVECRNAVRRLAQLQAEIATQETELTPDQAERLASLQQVVEVTGPQRWRAACLLAARAAGVLS
ncbi:hypothetical protein [Roseateles asaccharophilus]|uniref:Uncharacterized protein n=1 Tax=Roseateles asaccharophilus TaxID=582607 RepID=A0ABU2A541_9BURK|nr:hypothetical protein [Roseateles asaccharophilus]MDR7331738.1 hypothetical protein [Roseateles asaccharophilus]